MPEITAYSTAAFIKYDDDWVWNSDDPGDASLRIADKEGATASLKFRGSALYLYGDCLKGLQYNNPPVDCDVDGTLDGETIPIVFNGPPQQGVGMTEKLLYTNNALPDGSHNVELKLTSGTFGLSRIVWTDSQASNRSRSIEPTSWQSTGIWNPPTNNPQGLMCTSSPGASIAFSFQGTGILVQGMGASGIMDSTFDVSVEGGETSENLWARTPPNIPIDLYRNDGLDYGDHKVTLTIKRTEGSFCVSDARVFNAPRPFASMSSVLPNASAVSTPSESTASPSSSPEQSKSLTGGKVGGVVVGVLFIMGLLLGGLFLLRARRNKQATGESKATYTWNTISYDRLCSKCGKSITDDYRLECVDPGCPAAVDLHVHCEDWNTPERHTHAMHMVVNK